MSLPLFLLAPALSLVPQGATALVVDDQPGPGVDFVQIQAAIDSAPEGSLILIQAGSYAGGFEIDGKALELVADGQVLIEGPVRVRNVSFPKFLLLDGLQFSGTGTAVELRDCSATLWLEGLRAEVLSSAPELGVGLDARAVDRLTVTGCRFGGVATAGGQGVLAGRIVDSDVTLYGSTFTSVAAGPIAPAAPIPGVLARGSLVFAGHSTVVGASGQGAAPGPAGACLAATAGSAALQLEAGAFLPAAWKQVATDLQPGAGGEPFGSCSGAEDGPETLVSGNSSFEVLPSVLPARDHDVSSVLEAGTPGTIYYHGTPGEVVFLLVSVEPSQVFEPLFSGVFGAFGAFLISYSGQIPMGGEIVAPIQVGADAQQPWVRAFTQPVFFSVVDGFVLGPPRTTTLLLHPG
jgi:hypothetical protein